MDKQDINSLVAAAIAARPQFKSAIERMWAVVGPLNNSNVNQAFQKYLEKIMNSDLAEGAKFVSEMEKYTHAVSQITETLKLGQSINIDEQQLIFNHFPQVRRVMRVGLLIAAFVIGVVLYFIVFEK
jgi:hypothetical protein